MPCKSHKPLLPLAPGVLNSDEWRFSMPPQSEWRRIRKLVLERDGFACRFCGHRASKHMHVHHRWRGDIHLPRNLVTCCVACHAVLHIGLNLQLGVIEIWKSDLSQVQIVRKTRRLVKRGLRCLRSRRNCTWYVEKSAANLSIMQMHYSHRAERRDTYRSQTLTEQFSLSSRCGR